MNKQKINLTEYAREMRLVNQRKSAKVSIFKAILNTLEGNKTFYFTSLKALNDFAKREKNFGLQLFYLQPTTQKPNLKMTTLKAYQKCVFGLEMLKNLLQIWNDKKQQKKDITSSKTIDLLTKKSMVREVEKEIRQAKNEYDNYYNQNIRKFKAEYNYIVQVVSKWTLHNTIKLNTAILRHYN